MKYLISTLSLLIFLSSCSKGVFKEIKPDNKAISYIGRHYYQNNDTVISDWPGTYFRSVFTGTRLGIKMGGQAEVQFNVFIDDLPVKIISCNSGETIWVAEDLKPGKHTLQVFKRTESLVGTAIFKGLVIDSKAKVLPWKNSPDHRIEFIGNSITCGYGVEGTSRHDDFKPSTENNYLTYAAVLSRYFNADYSIVAHSGLGIVRHYGDSLQVSSDPQMPARYLRTLDSSDTLLWDFSSWKPDLVMINLGTNDFSTLPYPEKELFQNEYANLINTVRKNYGNIPVICLSGPLIGDPCAAYVKEVTERIRLQSSDTSIYYLGIPKELLNSDEDFGSDDHPSITGQKKIADYITPMISKELGWKYHTITK